MADALDVIKNTPVPTILVVAGLAFILLAFAGKFSGRIDIPPARQKWVGAVGGIILVVGIGLHAMPVSPSQNGQPTPTDTSPAPTQTPTATPIPIEKPSPTPASPITATSVPTLPPTPMGIQTVRVIYPGGAVTHGFFTPKGFVITIMLSSLTARQANELTVVWTSDGREQRIPAEILNRPTFRSEVTFLELRNINLPRFELPIRGSGSLDTDERIERYLGPQDRTPGKVLAVGEERMVGDKTIRNALITTDIAGPGDAGAPVIDGQGAVVGMVYGGGRTGEPTISIPIEDIKASFLDAF